MMVFRWRLWTGGRLWPPSPRIWHARRSLGRRSCLVVFVRPRASACVRRARSCCVLGLIKAVRAKAVAVQSAVSRSRKFRSAMLDGLPAGCRMPLSVTCHWKHRAYCKHQGRRLYLGGRPALAAKDCQCGGGGGGGSGCRCCLSLRCVPAGTCVLLFSFGRGPLLGDKGLIVVVTR